VLVRRHSLDLAVLSALGMTRRQRRKVAVTGGATLSAAGVIIGLPAGIVAGHLLWRAIATHLFLVPFPSSPWSVAVAMAAATVVVGAVVAWLAARRSTARRPGQLLRTE
jgi:ABC-type antimicrobial peptide transport system permease subunit